MTLCLKDEMGGPTAGSYLGFLELLFLNLFFCGFLERIGSFLSYLYIWPYLLSAGISSHFQCCRTHII
ncbi:hypothetical protein SDJN02_04460, partial [Cucurbita argyrosperma subsp. argyrosperma]